MSTPANFINHIVLALDASSSMQKLSKQLIKVADNQIAHLAKRSQELDQETRVTVYQFGSIGDDQSYARTAYRRPDPRIECLIYDKDVLRVPSISEVYKAWGNTPLIDATWLAIDDLAQTPEKYGEHSFLVYVLTDGLENDSKHASYDLARKIKGLPDNWTLATFVPDQSALYAAKSAGFPADNIAVWDTSSNAGIDEVGEIMRAATENFMTARAEAHKAGTTFRGTTKLFDLKNVSVKEVRKALIPLPSKNYSLLNVGDEPCRIDEFVSGETGQPYKLGSAFYQLSKREKIQPQKQIAIMGEKGVYVGSQARQLVGLPDEHVTVGPGHNHEYDIFVQSTSVNRKLMPGTKVLLLK